MALVKGEVGAAVYAGGRFVQAIKLLRDLLIARGRPLLTLPAHKMIPSEQEQ